MNSNHPALLHPSILVVDDNHQIADVTAGSILPSLGYESLVAYNGKSALNIIRKHHRQISLVLTDWQMPDLSGLELVRKLREEGYAVPAIIITAHFCNFEWALLVTQCHA